MSLSVFRRLGANVQRGIFSAGVWCVGGALVRRDRWLGRIKPARGLARTERMRIANGRQGIDAIFARPAENARLRCAVLICHGIGEVVEHWSRAQELLAGYGVASLVFNYSGCGESGGWLTPEHCERDAVAAFAWLQRHLPGVDVTLLGFSLGSGVAVAVMEQIPISGLILCEAYPSFREAVRGVGLPALVTLGVPDVWRSEETLRQAKVPVLVVHGACDRLFPVAMGKRMALAAGERGALAVVPGMGHADLHSEARERDWRCIREWLERI